MRTFNNFCRPENHSRYNFNCTLLSAFLPKTLAHRSVDIVMLTGSLRKASALCNCPSGSFFFPSKSCSLQEKHLLADFSLGSLSVFCLDLFSLKKKQSSGSPLSKSFPHSNLPTKSHSIMDSTKWSSSRCKIQSPLRHQQQCSSIFPVARPPVVSPFTLLKHDPLYVCSNFGGLHRCNMHRCLTGPSSNETFVPGPVVESEVKSEVSMCSDQQSLQRNKLSREFVLEMVDILRNDRKDMDSRLCTLASNLSMYSITEIFEALNSQRISGLKFFQWIWSHNSQLRKNSVLYSLIIHNVGKLDDYETMSVLLKKFTSEKACLTYKAFGFVPDFASTTSLLKESTKRVVDLLNNAGGSSCSSGVFALVEMFCKLDLFEMARYVIKITESKESYYCLMIREKCGRGLIEDAYGMIKEMREACCTTDARVYNYLLGSLWKNDRMDEALGLLDEMKSIGMHPDAITFEIAINSLCKLGKMDAVYQLLNQMKSQKLKPRLATHASIIKTLFAEGKHEAAYEYVVHSSTNFVTSGNLAYGLLAKLYSEKGDIMSAQNTLVEMMEKNLKPDFSLYTKIVKQFRRSGRADLARDLQSRHSRFSIK